ncbi:hypothetical protein EW145_g3834 [Phellinidium pouzarii]|uniref:AMMECR1 domain-containing protein n=1 Tax=Phellinidium pouzarii TaxID=167371 RepID=A0A4S4L5X8_9AGAM|nr:hypothetical protein EW145_g3834 [Phellinidium pouzarii]
MMSSELLVPRNPPANADSNAAIAEHCFHAFDAIYCALTTCTPVLPEFADEKYPLFVTWNTRSTRLGGSPRLRGCIGTFEAQPIREGLAEYALISAFKDSRFPAIQERELPNLECMISLLTNFEDASSYLDWTVGVHGIYISFAHPLLSGVLSDASGTPSPSSSSPSLHARSTRYASHRLLTATYLPDVMPEQGWNKIEAIDSAIHKAGWNGNITEDLRRSIKLRRYQSSKCTVGWKEFMAWRKENATEV